MSDSIKKYEEMRMQEARMKEQTKKYITDELIEQRLIAKGYGDEDSHDEEHVRNVVLKHFDLELTDNWSNDCSHYIYEESTVDGYSVYISTHDFNKIEVSSNIFYHDSDLCSAFKEAVYDNDHGDVQFYLGDIDADYVQEAICELYIELVDHYTDIVTNELIDEGYTIKQTDASMLDVLNLIANND